MRKRILSIVLCLSMALTLLPMAAFATEGTGVPAETISEPAPLVASANTVELNIANGAIKIFSDRYQIYNGSEWSETPYTGSYVITGTEQGRNDGIDYITVLSLASDATLTLKDLTIGSTKTQSALSLAGLPSVPGGEPSVPEVCIEGAVKLGGLQTAIKADGALNFTGSGSLALSVANSNSKGPNATAVISAASVAATLGGAITVTATANGGADIHAIHTTVGAVSLTSQNGAVSLTSGGTTAPLIMSAGAVTIKGYGDVAVTNATGGSAIIAGSSAVSLTSEIGAVNVTGKGNGPAIQAGAVTISGYGDVSAESTGGPAIIAGGGAVSLTSDTGAVNVTANGNGSAIGADSVTIVGMRDIRVNNTANDGSGISAPDGEVSLTSGTGAVNVQCKGVSPAIGANTLTIAAKGSVTVVNGDLGKDSGSAIVTRGAVSLTSADNGVRVYGGMNAISSDGGTVALKGNTFIEVSTKQTAQTAISTTGAVSLNAADIFVGGLIAADATFTAPEGALVTSGNAGTLITGTVTVAANTKLQLLGNAAGITYAADGSEGRTTVCVGDLSGGGEINTAGTYIAGNGTIVVTRSDDGKYTATMTNATVGGDLNFYDNCTITLVGQNQFDNKLSLLSGDKYLTLTINGTGELVAPNIKADNITINGGTVNAVNISSNYDNGTLIITGGTVNAETIAAENPSIASTAKVNAIVRNRSTDTNSFTVYGNVTLAQDVLVDDRGTTFTVPAGRSLTVPSGVKLYLIDCTGNSDRGTTGTKAITNSGAMTINGELMLPTAFKGNGAIKGLKLTGSGSVLVSNGEEQPGTYITYLTDGSQPHNSTTALTFIEPKDAGDLENDGYHWDNVSKTLTLKNLSLEVSGENNAITLPNGATLVLQGVSTVTGGSSAIDVSGNLTVSGAAGILKVGCTSNASWHSSIAVIGTLTVASGTILGAGNNASVKAGKIAIKAGTINLGASGAMTAETTLRISGGSVTTGDGGSYSMFAKKIVISGGSVTTGSGGDYSMCAEDIVISGGVVKTGRGVGSSILAQSMDGTPASITITGGTVVANVDNNQWISAGISTVNGTISITGGTVSATGRAAAIVALGGTITDTGMTATTTPTGGTLQSVIVNPKMTVTSYTADATLNAGEMGLPTNACTTVSLAKTQTPPDSGDTVTPPVPKPEPPKTDPATGNTEVSVPVKPVTKGDTSSATVPETAVSDAIAAAEKEAAKTGGSSSVTITVDAPEGAKTVETTLPGKSLSAVADGKTEGLKISTPVADLSFDSEALKNIAGMAGKDVKISATRVDAKALTDIQKSQVGDAPVFDLTITSDGKIISNFNGGTATVSVPYTPKDGENPEFITVWLLDDAGKLIPIEASYKDGKITFETGHFSRYAVGYLPFTDVKADWAYESIVYAYQNQLFSGVGENKFAPTDNMNRAMLWTVLYRMAGSPNQTETSANWYADAQAWAIANGISDGTNPDGNITREQLATILWRYAQSKKQDVSIGEDTNILSYDDFDQMSQYAIPALQWACGAGVITGKSDSVLDPAGNATRAEVATMLQRYAGLRK